MSLSDSKNANHPRVIVLLGSPGSGKGTQAELLARKLDIFHLETSEVIERKLFDAKPGDFEVVNGKKYFLEEEKKLRESGELMSPPLIFSWMKEKIKKLAKEGDGIVLSGSPRSLQESKEIIPLLEKLYGKQNITIISFKQNLEISVQRNSKRRSCELMRHPIIFSKETAALETCPLDGSKLVMRKDDDPKIIRIRLKKYIERTLPVIDYFKKEKLRIEEVSGEKTVAEVFASILKKLYNF